MTDTSTQDIAGQTETSNDNLIPPGAEAYEALPEFEEGNPTFEIARLAAFLDQTFPGEMDRTNVQVPDGPVAVAIRLLQSLSVTAHPSVLPRCGQEYCNQPQGHLTEHGVIHTSG